MIMSDLDTGSGAGVWASMLVGFACLLSDHVRSNAGARSIAFRTAQSRLRENGIGLYRLGTNHFTVASEEQVGGIWQ
jgi:hypothetical protein